MQQQQQQQQQLYSNSAQLGIVNLPPHRSQQQQQPGFNSTQGPGSAQPSGQQQQTIAPGVYVPYVKPISQYMLKKQQRAKEAAAAAALLPNSNSGAAIPRPPQLNSNSNLNISGPSVVSNAISGGSGSVGSNASGNVSISTHVKYRPPVTTQQQPAPVPRPQPVPQQQPYVHVPPPVQHVPYIPPPVIGPIFVRENLPESAWPEKINEAIKEVESKDPGTVIKGLNTILMKSFESDTGVTLQIENYPELLNSLGSLLDVLNPLENLVFKDLGSDSSMKINKSDNNNRADVRNNINQNGTESGTSKKRKIENDEMYVRSPQENEEVDKQWTSVLPTDGNQLFMV